MVLHLKIYKTYLLLSKIRILYQTNTAKQLWQKCWPNKKDYSFEFVVVVFLIVTHNWKNMSYQDTYSTFLCTNAYTNSICRCTRRLFHPCWYEGMHNFIQNLCKQDWVLYWLKAPNKRWKSFDNWTVKYLKELLRGIFSLSAQCILKAKAFIYKVLAFFLDESVTSQRILQMSLL